MKRVASFRGVFFVSLAAVACADVGEDVGENPGALVYGADNRLDWYQVTDAAQRAWASSSAALLNNWYGPEIVQFEKLSCACSTWAFRLLYDKLRVQRASA